MEMLEALIQCLLNRLESGGSGHIELYQLQTGTVRPAKSEHWMREREREEERERRGGKEGRMPSDVGGPRRSLWLGVPQ